MSYFFYTLIPLEFLLQFLLDKVSFPISDIVLASLSDKFIGIFIPFLVLLITGRKFLTAEWQKVGSKKSLFLAILLGLVSIGIIAYLFSLIIYVPVSEQEITITKVTPLIILLSTSSVMAAFSEEITFRYLFLKHFSSNSLKSWLLLIFSSILFGYLHIFVTQSWVATIPYMFFGLVLGIQYIRHKNIWYPIGIHVVSNFINSILPLIMLYIRQ
ncbi:CPBP family intramembrane glutamic endopeptidase [Tetragenococcus koreensis]|uniref:CAAX prenyl protease 2/Lysostaphin resistance protein A-like domain-containing protein n=1 Tax=Tetragenococcus koreensis TaxID=290335 RepID=A0AAN4UB11_9ENTE|nr:CPBP family intramembrane glutamic endopeptidase [Tetragenococcus koreensis]MCF1626292.1 CPBP family intramembrane metalloprotease [Tetragenococcus koreensis]MCF1630851.1 CPBP family intramembrane metalloprotease [Tetragenococcus koreensis]GEQ48810.1 hypothetical protein TK11N_06620 [Tetragenococcus koreensis]GEQ51199.1 hypothetical protein TK12N_05430 [Tetragenococcus koreensis]GEQ53848.1 hypothetical protein TK2N_06920 [Tetragenococcus koreensis]